MIERKSPIAVFNLDYSENPAFLTAPNREAIDRLNLPRIFTRTAEKAIKDLEITKPITITVMAPAAGDNNYIIKELGIGAYTSFNDKIIFQFNPNHEKIIDSLTNRLPRQIAHELNHWIRGDFYGEPTLLNALIFEGLATVYEENWGGKHLETEWGYALQPEQLKTEWQKAQKELNSTDFDYLDWFFGENNGHPRWTGYALGTMIVQNYLNSHPNIPMKELVRKPSREIASPALASSPALLSSFQHH